MTLEYRARYADQHQLLWRRRLRALSVVHFVFGGLALAGFCFGVLAVAGGIRSNRDVAHLVFAIVLLPISLVLVFVGSALRRPAHFGWCVAANIFICLLFPLGTLLGGITLSFLADREARALYDDARS